MIPGVQVVHIEQDGEVIVADVIGCGEPVIMAEIVFRADDDAEHRHLVSIFQWWEGAATPLTMVEGEDGVVTLVDEAETFRAA